MNPPENTVRLDRAEVEDLFRTAPDESTALLGLFRMVYPNFDDIEKVDGYPVCNKETSNKICRHFIELTRTLNYHRPFDRQLQVGGYWLNYGFSVLNVPENLPDWWVIPAPVILKEKVNA
jgi:hypothetical protein